MMRKGGAGLGIIALLIIIVVLWLVRRQLFSAFLPGKAHTESSSQSKADAQARGVFVREGSVSPRAVRWKQATIRFSDVWLEKGKTA